MPALLYLRILYLSFSALQHTALPNTRLFFALGLRDLFFIDILIWRPSGLALEAVSLTDSHTAGQKLELLESQPALEKQI